eukprot:snap_masked-scaffold_75-processed-gene-0.27-mRNA-1 protein AED:1.00 eAED:1.00 QI:0/0/0/0/1/1/3/0/68
MLVFWGKVIPEPCNLGNFLLSICLKAPQSIKKCIASLIDNFGFRFFGLLETIGHPEGNIFKIPEKSII